MRPRFSLEQSPTTVNIFRTEILDEIFRVAEPSSHLGIFLADLSIVSLRGASGR